VACYFLSGFRLNPDTLGKGGNTLRYDSPIITNESLPSWIGDKLDALRIGEWGFYQLPPMTPAEIKARWFIE
jgi:hypothetical protein